MSDVKLDERFVLLKRDYHEKNKYFGSDVQLGRKRGTVKFGNR